MFDGYTSGFILSCDEKGKKMACVFSQFKTS